MTRFGYTLMAEQNRPKDLVRYAISAEHRGFDSLVEAVTTSRPGWPRRKSSSMEIW